MLLRPKTNQRIQKNIKEKYFRYQQCLLNSKTQHGQFLNFILQIIQFLPTVCLFFKSQEFSNPILNQSIYFFNQKVFSFLIWSQVDSNFGISQMVILVIMSFFDVIFILCGIYTFVTQKVNSFSTKLIVLLLKFVVYFIVPFTELHLSVIMRPKTQNVDNFFQSLSVLTILFVVTLSGLFLKLKIKPFRKNNLFWRFTNQYQLQRFFLNVARTIVFVIDGITIASLVISLGLEYLLRFRCNKYYQRQYLVQVETGSNLILAAHCAFLCYKITGQVQLSIKILICLLFITLFKGVHDYFHENNKPLIFPLCKESPYLFYDFYFKLYQRFHQKSGNDSDSNQKFYYTTLKEHSRKCKAQTCPLKQVCLMKKNIMSQVEIFISEILSKSKFQRPDLQLLDQLWKLERGKKFSFRQLQGRVDIQTQFIIFSIQNTETRQAESVADSFISASNIQLFNSLFYDPLLSILKNFSEFYAQILKPKPKIETITRIGAKIRIEVETIQELYMDLLKKKVITFNAIELYIQFESYFLRCSSLSPQMLKKITMVQKSIKIEDIQQIYLPAINFYPESYLIEDVNMQCVSFLRYSRYQLKAKFIRDIILPFFRVEDYFDLNQQQAESFLMFIKKKQDEFACGNIKINIKFIHNKRIFVLVFEKKKKQQGVNYILVDSNFNIVQMTTQFENLKQKRHPENILSINWRQIFEKQLKPYQRELKLTKLIKIDLKQLDSILMCTLHKTLNQQHSVVSLKIMKNLKNVVQQRRSVVLMKSGGSLLATGKKHKLYFLFDMSDQKSLILKGQHNVQSFDKKRAKTQTLDYFAYQMRSNLVDFTLIKSLHYAKGIKTYRLIGNDLYNVDLQDKEAYITAFDENRRLSGQNSHLSKSVVDSYIIGLVIIIAIILTGLSVYLLISLSTYMQSISDDFGKINEINTFKMNFYRTLATFRDVASGLYQQLGRDWVPDILESYNHIQSNEDKKMFSNTQVSMSYHDFQYIGNLNELLQVIMSDVFMLTQNLYDAGIQYIHSTCILQLTAMIEHEDDMLQNEIIDNISFLTILKNWIGFGTIIGILSFYTLIFYFGYSLVSSLKRNLNQLMMISDNEARQGIQNAQKLIYVIEMTKKNFQIDFNNLISPTKKFRPRKKQKQIIIGPNLKLISIGSLAILFIINISIMLAFYFVLQSNFSNFRTMQTQGATIIGIYTDMCKQTNYIDHTGLYNMTSIELIRQQLQSASQYMDSLMFSDQTNSVINTYFLYNSCSLVYQNNYVNISSGVTCQNSTPKYQVTSAFVIGMLTYFTREHYQLINNVSDTFAATGVYSSLFTKIFTQMSQSIAKDQAQKLNQFTIEIQIWCSLLILINVFYCSFAIGLSIYVKAKGKSVQKLIKFLNPRKSFQITTKINQKNQNSLNNGNQKAKGRLKRLSLLQNQLQV